MSRMLKNVYVISATLVLILSLLASLLAGSVSKIEAKVGDVVWSWIADDQDQLEKRVVVVNIDENSLNRFGGWPWSRDKIAQLLSKVREEGAALRLVDIVFPLSTAQDPALASEINAMPTVMSQVLAVGADQTPNTGVLQGAVTGADCGNNALHANAVIANAATLKVQHAGHITPLIDDDGVVRRLPAVICHDNAVYPALSIAGFRLAAQDAGNQVSLKTSSAFWKPAQELSWADSGQGIPLDAAGNVLMPWYLPRQDMVSISASDVLEGRVPAGMLKNAWVLVGVTAFGGADTVPTPQSKIAAGIEVHLQFIQGWLDQRLPYVPNGAQLYSVVVSLLLSLFIVAFNQCPKMLGRHAVLLVTAVLAAASFAAHVWVLKQLHLVLPWLLSVTASFATYIMLSARSHLLSRQEVERLYQGLSSYLPEYVASYVAREDITGALSAKQEDVMILYADLRNFSSWCEQLSPQESGAILHSFYTVASQIITEMGGTVEEYIGDALVGVWRQPTEFSSAVQAGKNLIIDMEALFAMQEEIPTLPPLAVGVGMEYGEVIVGSFGPSRRRVHTLLGKSLSNAIKIEAMTQELAYPLIIGSQAKARLTADVALSSIGHFFLNDNGQSGELFIPAYDHRA